MMHFVFLIFSLVFLDSTSVFAQTLSLKTILKSVEQSYPKLKAQQFKIKEAQAKYKSSLGVFDPTLSSFGEMTRGYYDNEYTDASITQYTPAWGTKIEAGFRRGDGSFAIYDNLRETLSDGEFFGKVSIPLLRNGWTDPKRTKIKQTKLGLALEKNTQSALILQIKAQAAEAYFSWVAKGHILKQYRQLLKLAVDRKAAIKSRVTQGDSATIEFDDNSRVIMSREQEVNFAERDFLAASNKVSLYWRDDAGNLKIPQETQLPVLNQDLQKHTLPQITKDWIESHPLVQATDKIKQQADLAIKLTKNQTLPELNINTKLARDTGTGTTNLEQTELRSGVLFSYPLLNRKARYNLQKNKLTARRIDQNLELLKNEITTEITTALQTIQKAKERIVFAKQEWGLAQKVEKAEKTKFSMGDSGILFVNLREEYTAKAHIAMIYAYEDFYKGLARLQVASGGQYTLNE